MAIHLPDHGDLQKTTEETTTEGATCRAELPATLIVNTKSRTGQEAYEEAVSCLEAHGIKLANKCALQHHEKLQETVREHIHQGAKTIIVGGGDGTLRLVASQLLNTDVAMGILPLGTINDFARNLNLDPSIEGACRAIASGCTELVDVGTANDDIFLITVSLGFAVESQRSLRREFKKLLGPAGYLVACALALRRLRDLHVTLSYRDQQGNPQRERLNSVQVGVLNGHYWLGGAVEIPGLDLTSDDMAFYAVPPQRHLTIPRFLSLARDLTGERSSIFPICTPSEPIKYVSRPQHHKRSLSMAISAGRRPSTSASCAKRSKSMSEAR